MATSTWPVTDRTCVDPCSRDVTCRLPLDGIAPTSRILVVFAGAYEVS